MSLADAMLAAALDESDRPYFAKFHDAVRQKYAAEGPRSEFLDHCLDLLVEDLNEKRLPEVRSFSRDIAERLFREILRGDVAEDQIGALLMGLQPDRLPAETIAAFARVMRDECLPVSVALPPGEVLGDTCGTGSDTIGTYNVSTTIMFILAAAGIRIAKHGNRAVTSRCGSADVLEALGVTIDLDQEPVERCIEDVGIGFMFAPVFHRALKNVQNIRRTLGRDMPANVRQRSVFNVLGPLANPAKAPRQIIGVYEVNLVPKLAEVLLHLGIERAIVAYGNCDGGTVGLDEFSTAGPTVYAEVRDGHITQRILTPEEVGLPRADFRAFAGGDKDENARTLLSVLRGDADEPKMNLALLNAGAGIYLGGKADTIKDGVELARDLVRSGAAMDMLDKFREITNRLR